MISRLVIIISVIFCTLFYFRTIVERVIVDSETNINNEISFKRAEFSGNVISR